MKRIITFIVLAVALVAPHCVAQTNGNRMLVVGKDGSRMAFSIEQIDSIYFANVPGTASIEISVGDINAKNTLNPQVKASITTSGICQSFRYTVVPKFISDELASESDVYRYFTTFTSRSHQGNLTDYTLQNVHITSGTNTILAVAYDEFGVPCALARADFDVPSKFKVEITDVQHIVIKLNVTPDNEEMKYFIRCEEKNKIEHLSDEALFEQEKATFTQMAEDYMMPITDVIAYNTQSGTQTDFELSGYTPGTDYVIYIYGVKEDEFVATTGIQRIPVHTLDVQKQDVKFDITTKIVDGYRIDTSIKPVKYDGYYSFDVIEIDPNMSDAEIRSFIAAQWAEAVALYLSFDYTSEEILLELCTNGDFNMVFEKEANKTYVAYAYAVNDEAMLCSDIAYVKAQTTGVEQSDLIVDIDLSTLTPYNAQIHFYPSNYDEEYAVYGAPAREFAGLEGEALLQYIASCYPMTFSGDMEIEMAPLLPNIEFRVFAYGCKAGAPTTELFELSYTTPEPVIKSNLVGEVKYGKYYDSKKVAELEPAYEPFSREGVTFVPVDFVQTEGAELYTAFFIDKDLEGKTDDDLMSWIIFNADKYLTQPGTKFSILRAPYDYGMTGVAFVRDQEGSFSKLYKGNKLITTKGGESNPQEFVDNYPAPSNRACAVHQINMPKGGQNLLKADGTKVVKHSNAAGLSHNIKQFKNRK